MYLWPRLGPVSQTDLLGRLLASSPTELRARATTTPHPDTTWYPTGMRVPADVVAVTADAIRMVADDEGWPDEGVGDASRRAFDQKLAGRLHDTMGIVPADAAHPGVWAHIALVVAPDVARWRYPANAAERYVSTDRNVFGRLWWRAHRLGAKPADPAARLVEDQAVAIMERPSLAGRERLATALAQAVLNHPKNSQDLMREAAMRLRRQLALVEVSVLDDAALDALVAEQVAAAADSERLRQ